MKLWTSGLAFASLFALVGGCGAPESSETGGAGGSSGGAGGAGASGGTGILDVPCTDIGGCLRGDVNIAMTCTAPDSGSETSTWEAFIRLEADGSEPLGSCGVLGSSGLFQLTFGLSDSPDGFLRLSGPFSGGGDYLLGGPPGTPGNNGLYLKAAGELGDPTGETQVDTSFNCSEDCTLEVLPRDRPVGEPGSWVTYRFVVSCDNPIGLNTNPCGACLIAPTTFAFDAACYFAPPEL